MFSARSNHDDYRQPHVYSTSIRVEEFFENVLQRSTTDFSQKLEAFLLTGLQGML